MNQMKAMTTDGIRPGAQLRFGTGAAHRDPPLAIYLARLPLVGITFLYIIQPDFPPAFTYTEYFQLSPKHGTKL